MCTICTPYMHFTCYIAARLKKKLPRKTTFSLNFSPFLFILSVPFGFLLSNNKNESDYSENDLATNTRSQIKTCITHFTVYTCTLHIAHTYTLQSNDALFRIYSKWLSIIRKMMHSMVYNFCFPFHQFLYVFLNDVCSAVSFWFSSFCIDFTICHVCSEHLSMEMWRVCRCSAHCINYTYRTLYRSRKRASHWITFILNGLYF